MDIDYSNPLVVLLGAFNTQILRNPNWVKQNLFPDSSQEQIELKMNLEMMTEEVTSVMEIDGIRIEVRPGKLAIIPKDLSKEFIAKVYELLKRISEVLPHTPMLAYGINFRFTGMRSTPILWKKKNLEGFLLASESQDSTLELKQSMPKGDYRINFTISERWLAEKGYEEQLNFNFHTPINFSIKDTLETLQKEKRIELFMETAQKQAGQII